MGKTIYKICLLVLSGGLLLAACGGIPWISPMSPGFQAWGGSNYASNGERIYFTGTNDRGQGIPYTGGPSGGGMMMGQQQLSCAACHGADGRGGLHTMAHMNVMDAPDIRLATHSDEDEHGAVESDAEPGHDEGHEHEETLESFRQAVIDGQHPDGEPLDRDMPRWQLTDQDAEDLYNYLQSLP